MKTTSSAEGGAPLWTPENETASSENFAENFRDVAKAGSKQTNQCTQEEYLQRLGAKEPKMCACAWVGSRSLSWLPWFGAFSRFESGLLDRYNKEVSHQHIKFDDTGDNIGFGPHGLFAEPMERYDYRMGTTCYDAQQLRKSAAEVGREGVGSYFFFGNNCQRFVERVLAIYRMSRVSHRS